VPGDRVGFGPVAHLQAGSQIGPYVLVHPLGEGGMSVVWLATRADGSLRREVALKIPALARDRGERTGWFARECDILAGLEHPNIARLYDAGVDAEGCPYLALEFIGGDPLLEWCAKHQPDLPGRIELLVQVLGAVQYAHGRGVLHRDIKPSNVMVTPGGQVRLLDFGIARMLEGPSGAAPTTVRHPLTLRYASPEQQRGEPLGPASDVWSLGVVLEDLVRSGLKARAVDDDLVAIHAMATANLPANRYASAGEFAADLQAFLLGQPVRARPVTPAHRVVRILRRHHFAAAIVAALALLTLARGAWVVRDAPARSGVPPSVGAVQAGASIAVLPLVDMSEKHDQEALSDGISEELIAHLARVPDLRVIARTSSFQYKERSADAREIGAALGAAWLLEGSVRRAGGQLRVSVQLVRAQDGMRVWSQTVERPPSEVFGLEDEISASVADSLRALIAQPAPARDRSNAAR
jgi:TolB-like protein